MSRPSRIAIVKELGSRTPRCLAAHAVRGDEAELVIVERYPAALGADVLAVIEEDAKALVTLEQANLATLISTARLKGDVAILSEWVDGESLAVILADGSTGGTSPPIDVVVRAFADTLEALGALHASAASPAGQRVCGPFTPEDIFVGVDGVTRLTRFNLGRVGPSLLGSRRTTYAAPELTTGGQASIRGDVFTAGLILWECLTGEPMPREPTLSSTDISKRLAERDPSIAGLSAVIEKALATDPTARYATIAEMATAVASAGPKAAPRSAVSQHVARVFGERIAARLVKLEPKAGASLSMSAPSMTEPPPAIVVKPQPPTPAIELAPPATAPVIVAPAAVKPAEKPSDPKLVTDAPLAKTVDSSPRLQTAAAVRKPNAGAASLARKAVPLPKRPADGAPTLTGGKGDAQLADVRKNDATTPTKSVQASVSKVNGNAAVRHSAEASPATTATAKTPVMPKVIVDAPAPPEPADVDIDIPIHVSDKPPPSAREDIDSDIDIVSVRPPPAPKRKKSLPPAAAKEHPAADATAADEGAPAAPTSRRGVLLVGFAIIVFGGGFLIGRATSPEPAATAPTSEAPPTTATSPASVSAQVREKPTTTSVTSASTQKPTTVESAVRAPTQPPAASKLDGSSMRYDPGGI